MQKMLIVELDGGQHTERVREDQIRTSYLEKMGYRVIRFWDNEVLAQTDSILEVILLELEKPLTLPSP